MNPDTSLIAYASVAGMFASVILMHLMKRSSLTVWLYTLQSLLVVVLLTSALLKEFSWLLVLATLAMGGVKVIIAPKFFTELIRKHEVRFSASTYVNGPVTLAALAGLTAFTHAQFFRALTQLNSAQSDAILLSVSMMLISMFLIINRKGALSQMIGILSLENAIVAFATVTGLEQTPALQLGVVFDIFIWITIATVFASMIYQKFGSLDVSKLTHLTED